MIPHKLTEAEKAELGPLLEGFHAELIDTYITAINAALATPGGEVSGFADLLHFIMRVEPSTVGPAAIAVRDALEEKARARRGAS